MIFKKIVFTLTFLIFSLTLQAQEEPIRIPSFGPNGTHWPTLVPTPFLHDETIPHRIEVNADWSDIESAVNSLTLQQVNEGAIILIRDGILTGLGNGPNSTPALSNLGNASWTKRVTIAPLNGYGALSINGGMRFFRLTNICVAGFKANSVFIDECINTALAWSTVNGWLALFSEDDVVVDNIEFVEVVMQERINSNADASDVFTGGGDIFNVKWDGCYFTPRYIPLPVPSPAPHTDTLQFASPGGGDYENFTIRDTAMFASDNTALQTGGIINMDIIHSLFVAGTPSLERYPVPSNADDAVAASAINGAGQNIQVFDSVIIGPIRMNTAIADRPFSNVQNTRTRFATGGVSAPLNGEWTTDASLDSSIEGYPPIPTDAYLASIWSNNGTGVPEPDDEAPTIPQSVVATPLTSTTIQLTWQASTDNQRVSGYRIYQDGVFLRNATGTETTVGNLSPSTLYTFTIAAFDISGNASAHSAEASASTLARTNPNDFLLAHWPLDETEGNRVTDVIEERVGTFSGTPELGNGVVQIDSDEDRINVDSFNVTGNQITLSCWVELDSVEGFANEARFISKATSTASNDHYWMLGNIANGTAVRFRLKVNGSTTTLASSEGVISVGQRHHLVATFDGNTMRIYVDQELVASQNIATEGTITPSDALIGLGNQPTGAGGRGMRGDLDDVRIYSYAVPAEDLALISEQSNSSNFINWLENNGLSTELSPTDDSDKDGLPLLLEYAFDTDPLSFSPNPLKVEENEGQKTVTFPNVRSELNYLIETSEDIITWGTESVDQETGILSNEPDKLFIRVKVTQ